MINIEITSKTFLNIIDDDTIKDSYHELAHIEVLNDNIIVDFDSFKSKNIKEKHKKKAKLVNNKLSVVIDGADFDQIIQLIEDKVKAKLTADGHTVVDSI